jgi:hypothetical protein
MWKRREIWLKNERSLAIASGFAISLISKGRLQEVHAYIYILYFLEANCGLGRSMLDKRMGSTKRVVHGEAAEET